MERIVLNIDESHAGEYYLVEGVIDSGDSFQKSVPFCVRKSVREQFPKEEQFLEYLKRMTIAVIRRCGDARNPLPQAVVEGVA